MPVSLMKRKHNLSCYLKCPLNFISRRHIEDSLGHRVGSDLTTAAGPWLQTKFQLITFKLDVQLTSAVVQQQTDELLDHTTMNHPNYFFPKKMLHYFLI